MTSQSTRRGMPRHVALLWLLTAFFATRVAGQAIQLWLPQPFLPAFDAFQGSDLPYSILLSTQLLILAAMARTAWKAQAGDLRPAPRAVAVISWLGAIYMVGSLARIAVGLAVPDSPSWFRAWVPAGFHVVLAGFVLTLALHFRARAGRPI
jgi:hypothetical protein